MVNSDDDNEPRGYLILRPEELRPWELLRLLFSRDIDKPRSVDSSETNEPSFRRRWLIFVSLVLLKLLRLFSELLALLGSALEFFLNFLSANSLSGFFLRGEVVVPKTTSENYQSFIGHLDTRISLDKTMNREDGDKYYAALSIMASKIAYENSARIKNVVENHWNMKYLGLVDYWNEYQEKETTQAFIMSTDKTSTPSNGQETTVVVAFRGTEPFNSEDWCSDFDITWYELPNIGKIHGGFMKALGLQNNCSWPKEPLPNPDRLSPLAYYSIRDTLKTLIAQNKNTKFVLTGHSLGGALAILFTAVLVIHNETELLERIQGVYTYGQPRVGDSKFGDFMEKKLEEYDVKYYRFVYNNDIVPRLPYDDKDLMFKHFGTCIYYDQDYQAKVLREQLDENFFSLRGIIKMVYIAILEFIRSFTIVTEKGSEFREGWLLKGGRAMGIIVPGVSNHTPQDYVNATRLTPPCVFQIHRDVSIT
ncbi:Fungal lipase-like domain [Arabidopsis suecica]|uniref:Fungal lipase-like domain n=1 Tax=Arabidopsis suecica TaxID=45249 RepID=A0A8T1XXK1_ARASU|nr:Fungal lipase-like domain [Arabidopsis suecica]